MNDSAAAPLTPLTEDDFAALAPLARTIWRAHYGAMIDVRQVDYMIDQRFAPDHLRRYIGQNDRWFDVLRVDGAPIGYCSYMLTAATSEMKLEQLYLLQDFHGRGLGGLMIRHVEAKTRTLGCNVVMLQVARFNTGSIAVYRKSGFSVRGEVLIDIGEGFVMDDFVMEKRLV